MPSEAHAAIVSMLSASPPIALAEDGTLDVVTLRAGMEAMTGATPLPEGTQCEAVDAGGVAAEWIEGAGADASRALLYLHGGGYVLGSINTHRGLVARIAAAAGTRGLAVDYRLGPEHPFPAAVDDAVAAYEWLLGQGVAPERVAIGGDSAGGGLTFATLVALRDKGTALPGCAIALSPWVDLEGLGESMTTRAEADPMLGRDSLVKMSELYLNGADPKHPLAAPLYADLAGLPPTYIQVGTAETLLDDATRIAERAKQAGVDVQLEPFEDLVHVFQAFAPAVPEAVDAIEKLGSFVKRQG